MRIATEEYKLRMLKFQKLLSEFKNSYHVKAIRLDIAGEVVESNELQEYAKLAHDNQLDLTVKIGGCDAITDIYFAKSANAASILAPMIETPFALKKFIDNCKQVYNDALKNINLFINIETITAYNNLDEILSMPEINDIQGIVLGRDDMVKSLGLNITEVNSDEMLTLANNIADKVFKHNKEFIIGGQIRSNAVKFLQKISNDKLSGFETRRVVFEYDKSLPSTTLQAGINKAIEFEIEWLQGIGKKGDRGIDLQQQYKTTQLL